MQLRYKYTVITTRYHCRVSGVKCPVYKVKRESSEDAGNKELR